MAGAIETRNGLRKGGGTLPRPPSSAVHFLAFHGPLAAPLCGPADAGAGAPALTVRLERVSCPGCLAAAGLILAGLRNRGELARLRGG